METENVFAPMEWRGAMTALVTPPNSYWRLRSAPTRGIAQRPGRVAPAPGRRDAYGGVSYPPSFGPTVTPGISPPMPPGPFGPVTPFSDYWAPDKMANALPAPMPMPIQRAPGQHVQPPPGRRFGRIWPWGGVGRGGF